MVTENVNIRFVESGARVIKRRIDDIGESANRATRGIFLLQRALFVLGGAGLVTGLARIADGLTNMENRLRLTTASTAELEAVQSELFNVARRSRSNLEGTADVYNRIALSARNLGVGQQQVLDVTETLQQAAILSGASAREANAALIQLGQGIASDRLSGDELRSVLEQLPIVADIIVDYLNDVGTFGNVTRGSLRELASEGELTAEVVFRAIQASQQGIADLFAETQPTIEQAFNVARTNLLEFVDTIDDATNASARIANLIIGVSENFDVLVASVALVGTAIALSFGARAVASLAAFINSLRIAGGAISRYFQIQSAVKTIEAQRATALATSTAATVTNTAAINARAQAQLISAQREFADAQAAFQNGRARSAQTGQFIALQAARDRLTAATIRLDTAERINTVTARNLTAARIANTAAVASATTANSAAAVAAAAQTSTISRLSATFPILTGAARLAGGAISSLFAILAANPIGAVISTVVLLGVAIATLGDRFSVTSDGVVSLKDAAIAAFQLIREAIQPVIDTISGPLNTALQTVSRVFGTTFSGALDIVISAVSNMIDIITFLPRVVIGVIAGIIASFNQLPAVAGAVVDAVVGFFVDGFQGLANAAVAAINVVIGALNSLASTGAGQLLGLSGQIAEAVAPNLDGFRTNLGAGAQGAAEAFADGFQRGFEGSRIQNIASNFSNAVIERARRNIAAAQFEAEGEVGVTNNQINPSVPGIEDAAGGGGGGGGGGANSADFASELAELQQRIELERQYGIQKEITNNILGIERTLKRELTQVEAEQVARATELLEISRIQGEVLESILGPQETLRFTQQALNELFAQGAINLEQYNTALRETQIAADRAANTLGGGFRAAIASSIQSAGQFGETLGNFVVGAANQAADAIVDFAKTGQFNIRAFFQDLFAQLLKLAAQRLLLQFIGGFLGIPGAGLAGFNQGGSILPSFATGGSIMPTGPGSTDSQVVAFNKRPDERVDILTPGQQAAQRNAMNGGGGNSTTVNTTTNVAAVLSPNDIVNAFDGAEGETVVVNMIQRNASTIRQVLG